MTTAVRKQLVFILLIVLSAVYLFRFPEDGKLIIDMIATAVAKFTGGGQP